MRIIIRAVKERAEFIDYLQKHLPNAEWYFDKTKNIWSKKKQLRDYQPGAISTRTPKHIFTGTTRKGCVSLPLPL
jgi:hypothetical protein